MSEGKQPGKVRKAARRAWGSLFGQEVLGQEETAQVMRQEVFGVEIGLHTGGGGVSWRRLMTLLAPAPAWGG